MFTGIVEDLGKIKQFAAKGRIWNLVVSSKKISKGLKIGQSVAVNGTCLTAVEVKKEKILFQIQKETLRCTALGELKAGEEVNLERALKASGRFDGHIVQGHVDTVAKVKSFKKVKKDVILELSIPKEIKPYLVPKGSITINGVSLTIVKVGASSFTVHLIPITLEKTTLRDCLPNGKVNIEADILAKYMARLLRSKN